MAATSNGQAPTKTTALDVLTRADSRWAKDQAGEPAEREYLAYLAKFLEPVAADHQAPPIDEKDLALLREQVVAAENNAAARRSELDQARAEIEHLKELLETNAVEADRRVRDVLDEKKRVETERDKYELLLAEARLAAEQTDDSETVREQATLIGKLRDDYDAVLADKQKVSDELAAMTAERNHLAKRLTERRDAATSHRCAWQWHGPDEPIKPCSCGRPVPRYELREVG